MKKILVLVLMLCTVGTALGNISGDDKFRLNELMGGVASEVQLGTLLDRTQTMQKAQIDATAGLNIGDYYPGITLPKDAIITKVWYDIITTFTSAGDVANISLRAQTAEDLAAKLPINHATNPWDAGIKAGIPTGTAATMIKMTSIRQLAFVVETASLTGGKMDLYVEYVQSN